MRIIFEDAYGMQEAGIDGGGLFKDFMENLVKQAFDPFFGLFLSTSDNRMYPNPNAHLAVGQATQAFEYIGKMVGKALYEVSCPLTTISTLVARPLYLEHQKKNSKSLFQRWLWVGVWVKTEVALSGILICGHHDLTYYCWMLQVLLVQLFSSAVKNALFPNHNQILQRRKY